MELEFGFLDWRTTPSKTSLPLLFGATATLAGALFAGRPRPRLGAEACLSSLSEVRLISARCCVAEEFATFSAAFLPDRPLAPVEVVVVPVLCRDLGVEEPDDSMRAFPTLTRFTPL